MRNIVFIILVVLMYNHALAQTSVTVEANNKFAIDLFQKISEKEHGNIFFSPLSLTSAIGMTCAGANSESKNQIEKVFHFPIGDSNIHSALGKFQRQFSNLSTNGIELRMVNKLWAEQTYKISKNYIKLLRKDYSSSIELVDFIKLPESARVKINSYVSDQTVNKINELLPNGAIDALAKLVITNAIYFKGEWQTQFNSKKTKEVDFSVSPEKKVTCQMMSLNGSFKFFEGEDYQALEVPYKGENISMLIILPIEGNNIETFQKRVTYNTLNDIIEGLSDREVWVLLPRFKSSTNYQLKPILSDMGMPIPFSNDADFSKISPKNDLKIFDIYHKAFVEVNEKGTEAAAATAVIIGVKTVQRSFKFEANRPFIYIIKDNKSGIALFMGRLSNPMLN